MNITELIQTLKHVLQDKGDLPVYYPDKAGATLCREVLVSTGDEGHYVMLSPDDKPWSSSPIHQVIEYAGLADSSAFDICEDCGQHPCICL